MSKKLHVAAAQIWGGGGVDGTLSRLERQVRSAVEVEAEIILFAECVLHGYDYDMTAASVRKQAETTDGKCCRFVRELATQRKITILAGFFEEAQGHIYNSMLIARPDNTFEVARKHLLSPCDTVAEISSAPRKRKVFEINGIRCTIVICADAGIQGLHDELREDGVEYRFCPTGGGGRMANMLHEEALDTVEGREHYAKFRKEVFIPDPILGADFCPHTGFTSANALGPFGSSTCHQGHCMIVDNRRTMRAQIPGTIVLEHMQDQLIHAELNF